MSKSKGQLDWLAENPLVSIFSESWSLYTDRRQALGLSNPGTFENVTSEVTKGVFLNNLAFTGLRADLTRIFGVAPMFQVSHAFSMGLGGPGSLPPYTFTAIYGTNETFLQANMDNEKSLSARFNYRWTQSLVSKFNTQISPSPGQAMLQIDHDYVGMDSTASLKAYNPSFLDGGLTGIYILSYLQAVTKSLSLGVEAFWQRTSMLQGPESAVSYAARYQGSDWVGALQYQAQGILQATYWRKLGERVEAGVESQLTFGSPSRSGAGVLGGGMRKDGVTTIGAKYDFRNATMRAQVDTTGKLSCLLEKRVAPPVTMVFSGEMDHFKNQAKVGLAVSIEIAAEELMEQVPGGPSVSVPL